MREREIAPQFIQLDALISSRASPNMAKSVATMKQAKH